MSKTNESLMQRRVAAVPRGVGQIHPIFADHAKNSSVVDVEGRATGAEQGQSSDSDARYVLLVEPAATRAEPLMTALLLECNEATEPLWWHCGLDHLMLIDLLERRHGALQAREVQEAERAAA